MRATISLFRGEAHALKEMLYPGSTLVARSPTVDLKRF